MRVNRRVLRTAILIAAAGLLLAPVAVVFLFFYGPRLQSGFEKRATRIQIGMTIAEVEQVLGFAGAEQEPRYVPAHWSERGVIPFVHGDTVMLWEKDGEQVWVGFENGRVVSKKFHDLNYL